MKRAASYQIKYGEYSDEWIDCKRALPERRLGQEWLHYELADGTIGLKRPGTWRVKPNSAKRTEGKEQ